MAFDQDITYRVNIDDSNFQAKLTQLRASMDSSLTGGGMGGGGFNQMAAMAQLMSSGGSGTMNLGGGLADFGSQIKPVTYTPPAIAMQPHFGMYQIQQTLGQAGLGAMGPVGSALYSAGGAIGGFMRGGFTGAMNAPGLVPGNMTSYEYFNASAQSFANRTGDAAAMGAMTVANIASSIPFTAAGSALGAAAFGGAGVAAMAGGLLGGAALSAVPAAYFAKVGESYRENVAMQEALQAGSFRFVNSGPDVDTTRGRGFSRQARGAVAEGIQRMQLQDVRYGASEYSQILEGGMQMDLFSGTRDAQDFQGKFKGLVESVKTITSTLHTSLKEGLEVIRGFRDMGVTDPSQIQHHVLSSEVMGRASGRTGMEMMAIGQTGAEMFRGTGISMQRGFELNQMNTMMIRQGLNNGTISRETVAQAGGELAYAQQMTAGTLASFQTTVGRGMLMGAYNQRTGTLDMGQMLRPGSAEAMAERAASNLSIGGIIGLQANQEELISQMSPMQMRLFSANQGVMLAKTIMQVGGKDVKARDAFIYAQQMMGKSKEQAKEEWRLVSQSPEEFLKAQQSASDAVASQTQMEDVANRFGSIGKRISNAVTSAIVEPVKESLLGIRSDVAESVESASQALMATKKVDAEYTSKEIRSLAQRKGAGAGYISAQGFLGRKYADLVGGRSSTGALDEFADRQMTTSEIELPGGRKESFETITSEGGGRAFVFKTREEAMQFQKATGETVQELGTTRIKDAAGNLVDRVVVRRKSDIESDIAARRNRQVTDEDRKSIEKAEVSDELLNLITVKSERLAADGKKLSLQDLSQLMFSKDAGKMTTQERAYLEKVAKQGDVFTATALKELQDSGSTSRITDAIQAGRAVRAEDAEKLKGDVRGLIHRSGVLNEAAVEGLGKLSAQELALISSDKEEDRAAALRSAQKKVGLQTARNIAAAIGQMSVEDRKALSGKTKDLLGAVGDIEKLAEAGAAGIEGIKDAGGVQQVGDISKNAMLEMKKISEQMVSTYKLLLQYQEQLLGGMKR